MLSNRPNSPEGVRGEIEKNLKGEKPENLGIESSPLEPLGETAKTRTVFDDLNEELESHREQDLDIPDSKELAKVLPKRIPGPPIKIKNPSSESETSSETEQTKRSKKVVEEVIENLKEEKARWGEGGDWLTEEELLGEGFFEEEEDLAVYERDEPPTPGEIDEADLYYDLQEQLDSFLDTAQAFLDETPDTRRIFQTLWRRNKGDIDRILGNTRIPKLQRTTFYRRIFKIFGPFYDEINRLAQEGQELNLDELEFLAQHNAITLVEEDRNLWQKKQRELIMEQQHGKKGGAIKSFFHWTRRFFAGDIKKEDLAVEEQPVVTEQEIGEMVAEHQIETKPPQPGFLKQQTEKHAEAIENVSGFMGRNKWWLKMGAGALGLLIGSPAAWAVGGSYIGRGVVEGIKRTNWTENRRRNQDRFSLDEKLQASETFMYEYVNNRRDELESVLQNKDLSREERVLAINQAVTDLVSAKQAVESQNIQISVYTHQEDGKKYHKVYLSGEGEEVKGLDPDAVKIGQSISFQSLLGQKLKTERRAAWAEFGASLIGGYLAGTYSVAHEMAEKGATMPGVRPVENLRSLTTAEGLKNFGKALINPKQWFVNIHQDAPNSASEYHKIVSLAGEGGKKVWHFAYSTADKIAAGISPQDVVHHVVDKVDQFGNIVSHTNSEVAQVTFNLIQKFLLGTYAAAATAVPNLQVGGVKNSEQAIEEQVIALDKQFQEVNQLNNHAQKIIKARMEKQVSSQREQASESASSGSSTGTEAVTETKITPEEQKTAEKSLITAFDLRTAAPVQEYNDRETSKKWNLIIREKPLKGLNLPQEISRRKDLNIDTEYTILRLIPSADNQRIEYIEIADKNQVQAATSTSSLDRYYLPLSEVIKLNQQRRLSRAGIDFVGPAIFPKTSPSSEQLKNEPKEEEKKDDQEPSEQKADQNQDKKSGPKKKGNKQQ